MKNISILSLSAFVLVGCGSTPSTALTQAQIYSDLIEIVDQYNNQTKLASQNTPSDIVTDQYVDLVPTEFIKTPLEPIQPPTLLVDPESGDIVMDAVAVDALNEYSQELAGYQQDGYFSRGPISISSCSRRVHQAHVSQTQPAMGNVISKGDVTCTPSRNTIQVVAQMRLYRASNYAFPVVHASGPNVSMYTSSTKITTIPMYNLWAHGRCQSANYYGSMNMRYSNLQGGVIAISAPLTGNARFVSC